MKTIYFDQEQAEAAFAAHKALIETEQRTPALAGNAFWQALRDAAFARFRAQYERR